MGRLTVPDTPRLAEPEFSVRPEACYGQGSASYTAHASEMIALSAGQRASVEDNAPTFANRKVQILQEFYQFRDHTLVTSFLHVNSFLGDLLFEAYGKAQEYFGSNTPLALEVFTDPENQAHVELFVLILTNLSPTDASSLLARLDQEWWLEASGSARNRLNIDVEFM